jgi:hypothetical protein
MLLQRNSALYFARLRGKLFVIFFDVPGIIGRKPGGKRKEGYF